VKKRRTLLFILLALPLLVFLIASAVMLGLVTREQPLLEHAIPIVLPHSDATAGYFWLSDQKLLLYGDPPPQMRNGATMFLWDIATKARQELPVFSANINQKSYGPAFMDVSPNTEWAVWYHGEVQGGGVCFSRLDGTHYEDYAEERPSTSL